LAHPVVGTYGNEIDPDLVADLNAKFAPNKKAGQMNRL
jgi:hypothetical protein